MIQQVMTIVAPLFLLAAVGYFYGARMRPEMRITNQLVMDIFMPALIFHVMIQDDFVPAQYFALMLAGALLMLGSGVIAFLFSKVVGISWRAFVPPAMFSNWANLGLPLYVFALGEHALGAGVMLVVVGNIFCFTIGTYIYSGKLSSLEVLKTPMIVAVVVGGLINLLNVSVPAVLLVPINMLGQVAIPLMLFSLGVRLTRASWRDSHAGLVMAVFCPVVGVALAFLLIQIFPMSNLHQSILILFGALPPAVINFMLAEQYQTEPDTVASMVLIGNLFAIVSLPIVLYFVLTN
ncbi:transporter [Arenicella chitinivorans]|uniref:Transporter n=1 Tax=Arenicella chitinivorans TaxID=1329800 RepID=A0A918RPL9_9GAMM|nr:AEC family transporter [Arenicella chitinivorans]GHA07365.1 transporter [Arenicella chitinivorans]